ncbi:hypothetical protein ACMYR3_10950 [Ampullimonas aquatilis]|uniref:hypothetical protein n=1 Tax=Ampullimonas aquatilis TaxID=1341549 RepID=UPI003C78C0D8
MRFILFLCLMTLTHADVMADESMGRLFMSVAERRALDKLRQADGTTPITSQTLNDAPVTLNGFLKRSSGKTTVWINQLAHNDGITSPQSHALATSVSTSNVLLTLRSGKNIHLKVGQTFDTETGVTHEISETTSSRQIK